MNILKKVKDLLHTDVLAFIITDKTAGNPLVTSSQDNKNKEKDVSTIYYKGAWKDEGTAKWAFFEEKVINTDYSTVKLLEDSKESIQEVSDIKDNDLPAPEPVPQETVIKTQDLIEEEQKKVKTEEVVSITEMGRSRTSRYQPEESDATGGLIDQREVQGEKSKIKVFFAEDNRSFQIIIQKLLQKTEDMELLGWATDGRDAVEKIKKLTVLPDVILMDIAMPRLDGISAIKEILAFNPSLKIVMLTAFGDKEHVQGAFDAGAIGFLRKDAGLPLIKEALKQAARGGRPVHKEVAHYLKEEQ
jgi:CheY-like chemotaxis protein